MVVQQYFLGFIFQYFFGDDSRRHLKFLDTKRMAVRPAAYQDDS